MQLNDNIRLPYPCLYLNIAEEENNNKPDFEILHHNIQSTTFRLSKKVHNDDIESLIKSGKAKYCLEMDCQRTFYRDAFLNETGTFEVTLTNNRYNGKLIGTLSVVAVTEINNYKNVAFDSFYDSFDINIGPGEALAYLGTIEFMMEQKDLEVKRITDDFIEIVADETIKYSRFDLGGEKILLKLPQTMYDQYQARIVSNKEYESYLHASFLLNILTSALQNIGTYQNTKWAETLRDRIIKEDVLREIAVGTDDSDAFDAEGNLANPDVAIDLAQAILEDPYKRMFDSFEKANNKYYDD